MYHVTSLLPGAQEIVFPAQAGTQGGRGRRVACPRAQLWTRGHRLAFAMSLSQSPPYAPTRTPAALPRPHPTHSPPAPRKDRHSAALSVPRHCPIHSYPRPTHATGLRHFSPPIRPHPAFSPPLLKCPHIRAIFTDERNRPRGPETPPPTGKDRRGIPCGCPASLVGVQRQRRHGRSARSPPVLFCHAAGHLCPELPTPALQN